MYIQGFFSWCLNTVNYTSEKTDKHANIRVAVEAMFCFVLAEIPFERESAKE